jgi:RNA polymerase sigma factor (sigma-70 family)
MISQDFTNSDRAHLVRFVRSFVHNRDTAEDIAQESLLRAQRYDSSEVRNFTNWLYKIARNLCVDHYRRRETASLEEVSLVRDARPPVHETIDRCAMEAQVRRAVADLPYEFRSVVEWHYFDGLSYEEIAEKQQSTIGSVKQRMFRAKAKLRMRLVN